MSATSMDIARRHRRITGLRYTLISLNVYVLVFALRLDRECDPHQIRLENWAGQDANGNIVEFRSLALDAYYVKDLCFLVRDEHELIIGRWLWWIEDDVVHSVPEGMPVPIRRVFT